MFELYDLYEEKLVASGSVKQLALFTNRSVSAVRRSYFDGTVLAEKYKVVCDGVDRDTSVNLYNVYDLLNNGKKIITNKKASDISKELYISKSQIYISVNQEKPICHKRYLIKKVG